MVYWKLPNKNCIVKIRKDNGLDDDGCDIKNILSAHLGAFIASIIKKIMNNFVRERNHFYNTNVYYTDTDSLYIKKIIGMCQIKLNWSEVVYAKVKKTLNLIYFFILCIVFSSQNKFCMNYRYIWN